jgi:hypothetical protein
MENEGSLGRKVVMGERGREDSGVVSGQIARLRLTSWSSVVVDLTTAVSLLKDSAWEVATRGPTTKNWHPQKVGDESR